MRSNKARAVSSSARSLAVTNANTRQSAVKMINPTGCCHTRQVVHCCPRPRTGMKRVSTFRRADWPRQERCHVASFEVRGASGGGDSASSNALASFRSRFVEPFGEPAINRSEHFAAAPASIGRARAGPCSLLRAVPRTCLLTTRDCKRLLEIRFRFCRVRLRRH